MNTNKRIDEVLMGGCDDRNRGFIDEGHDVKRSVAS